MDPVLIGVHYEHGCHEFDHPDPNRMRRSIARGILIDRNEDDSDDCREKLLEDDLSHDVRNRDFVFDWKFGLNAVFFERRDFEGGEDVEEDGECPVSNHWAE